MKNKLSFQITILVISILNTSCSNNDIDDNIIIPVDDFNITQYHMCYAKSQLALDTYNSDNIVKLEYDNQNRIIKKNGNISPLPLSSGFEGILNEDLYTDFKYFENEVYLVNKISPVYGLEIKENKTTLILDKKHRIIQKISFDKQRTPERDTINYTYDSDSKLTSYIKTNLRGTTRNFEKSEIYYSSKNVDSIITISSKKVIHIPHIIYVTKKIEKFGDYDSAENPFRKLQLFEETFYRSLSNNNFAEYKEGSMYYVYTNNDLSKTPTLYPYDYYPHDYFSTRKWSFKYDKNGELIHDQFSSYTGHQFSNSNSTIYLYN